MAQLIGSHRIQAVVREKQDMRAATMNRRDVEIYVSEEVDSCWEVVKFIRICGIVKNTKSLQWAQHSKYYFNPISVRQSVVSLTTLQNVLVHGPGDVRLAPEINRVVYHTSRVWEACRYRCEVVEPDMILSFFAGDTEHIQRVQEVVLVIRQTLHADQHEDVDLNQGLAKLDKLQ